MNKVFHGTPTTHSGPSLCVSCRHGVVVDGTTDNQSISWCQIIKRSVHFPVRICSEYDDKSSPSLWDMKDIALRLVIDKTGKIGFLGQAKFREAISEGKASEDVF